MDGPPPSDPGVLGDGAAPEPVPPPQQEPAVTTRPSQVSNSSVARSSRATSQQPQAHQLLSANFTKPTPAQTPTQHSTQPVQVTQPSAPQGDLFSLDFHAPPPPADVVPEQPRKDLKQDILSLYSTPSANPPTNPMNQFNSGLWSASSQPQQPTSLIGNTGVGAWGTSSGWAPPVAPPSQQNVWNTPTTLPTQQTDLFNTNDVWGNSSSQSTTGPGTSSARKNDAFSDIWGSFK